MNCKQSLKLLEMDNKVCLEHDQNSVADAYDANEITLKEGSQVTSRSLSLSLTHAHARGQLSGECHLKLVRCTIASAAAAAAAAIKPLFLAYDDGKWQFFCVALSNNVCSSVSFFLPSLVNLTSLVKICVPVCQTATTTSKDAFMREISHMKHLHISCKRKRDVTTMTFAHRAIEVVREYKQQTVNWHRNDACFQPNNGHSNAIAIRMRCSFSI